MGSVLFPAAPLKFFLTARSEVRAQRRFEELRDKGKDDTIACVLRQLEDRDQRDREREKSPLVAPKGAIVVDTSDFSIEEVVELMMVEVRRCGLAV